KLYLIAATVGLFAVASQIASVPAVIVAGCLSQFITPIVFQRARSGNSAEEIAGARRVMLVGAAALLLLTLVSSAAAAVLGDRLILFFTAPAYRQASPYIAPLVLGLGFMQIGHMLSLLAMSSNRLGALLTIQIVHGLRGVALTRAGVYAYALAGLCVGGIGGGAIYGALIVANNTRIMRVLALDARAAMPKPLLQP